VHRVRQTITYNKIGVMAHVPKAFEISRVMLAIAIEEEEPVDGIRQMGKGVTECGSLAVRSSRKGENFGASFGSQAGRIIAAAIVDDADRKTGVATSANNAGDGGRFVAGRNKDQGARFFQSRTHGF